MALAVARSRRIRSDLGILCDIYVLVTAVTERIHAYVIIYVRGVVDGDGDITVMNEGIGT
jgi:hypothetical protein